MLGQTCRVFAIDLLGYGYSDKPDPRSAAPNSIYNFENWGQQALDFLDQVVGGPAVVVTNSVGGLVGLQAALQAPARVPAVMVMNISLRMLHVDKQEPWQRPLVATLQRVLRESELGRWFFGSVAKPQVCSSGAALTIVDHVDCSSMIHMCVNTMRVDHHHNHAGGAKHPAAMLRQPRCRDGRARGRHSQAWPAARGGGRLSRFHQLLWRPHSRGPAEGRAGSSECCVGGRRPVGKS